MNVFKTNVVPREIPTPSVRMIHCRGPGGGPLRRPGRVVGLRGGRGEERDTGQQSVPVHRSWKTPAGAATDGASGPRGHGMGMAYFYRGNFKKMLKSKIVLEPRKNCVFFLAYFPPLF